MSTFDGVIEVLKTVSETDEVQKNPDLGSSPRLLYRFPARAFAVVSRKICCP